MSKAKLRILTGASKLTHSAMEGMSSDVLEKFLGEEIEELEYKLRYSTGETQRYQGALRALDDILSLLL